MTPDQAAVMAAPAMTVGSGRYQLGPVIGTGGMASVRRGVDTVLGRPVAVKVFRPDLDGDGAQRAELEMQTLAALSHPGLVAVFDAGTEPQPDGQPVPYLVMELVEGPTLATCCTDGSLGAEQLAEVGARLAEALDYVHSQGVIHRDVKPANVLVAASGAKLADFGIARIVDGARHTGTGLTIGTAPYLSPEQVTGANVGPPTDIYALGLVLLECLTGRREYDGSAVECALARLHRPPQVPRSLPAPWPELLTAMTSFDPTARPTAVQVANVLASAATLPAGSALPVTALQPLHSVPVQQESARRNAAPLAVPLRDRSVGGGSTAVRRPRPVPLRRAWLLGAACLLALAGVLALPHPSASGRSRTLTPRPGPSSAAVVASLAPSLAAVTLGAATPAPPVVRHTVVPVKTASAAVTHPAPTHPATTHPATTHPATTASRATTAPAPAPAPKPKAKHHSGGGHGKHG